MVNTPSTYNLLLGRPSLNRLGEVASTKHMMLNLVMFNVLKNPNPLKDVEASALLVLLCWFKLCSGVVYKL